MDAVINLYDGLGDALAQAVEALPAVPRADAPAG